MQPTYVVATWNGIPADNSGRRSVMYLTDVMNPMGTMNVWTHRKKAAKPFNTAAEAEEARLAIKMEHARNSARVFNHDTVHIDTGGLPGYEWD